jgi:3-hydroxyanthranilate 3,4-dioxygenase
MSQLVQPLNFLKWIDEHRHLLKPPVGNKVVWKDADVIVMVVGGPNSREDYHYNETPEFFYQIEGDIVLKVIEDGVHKDIHIREGEIFVLPPKIPHSPQRGANTIGLVIEYPRPEGVKDKLQWYSEDNGNLLYEEEFTLGNIETDMPAIFERYNKMKESNSLNK